MSAYHPGVIRTQISLTEQQVHALRSESRRRQISVAAVIRALVDMQVPPDDWEERERRALTVVGIGPSGASDVAERHDDYLAEAIAAEHGIGG